MVPVWPVRPDAGPSRSTPTATTTSTRSTRPRSSSTTGLAGDTVFSLLPDADAADLAGPGPGAAARASTALLGDRGGRAHRRARTSTQRGWSRVEPLAAATRHPDRRPPPPPPDWSDFRCCADGPSRRCRPGPAAEPAADRTGACPSCDRGRATTTTARCSRSRRRWSRCAPPAPTGGAAQRAARTTTPPPTLAWHAQLTADRPLADSDRQRARPAELRRVLAPLADRARTGDPAAGGAARRCPRTARWPA